MSWISARIPDRRQRIVSLACLLIFAVAVAVAVLTSRASDWQPLSLVLALLAFSIASELMSFAHVIPTLSPWVYTSTAPMALTVVLLGPAPALAIGVVGLTADAIHRRPTFPNTAANLANYGLTLVGAALISRWLATAWGLAPDEAGFAFLILAIYTLAATGSHVINAATGALLYRDPMRNQFKRETVAVIGTEAPTSFLTAGAGYAYGVVGLEALGLLAVAQLTYQYLAFSLVISQERSEALQKRADKLAALQITLEAQASRLAEVSASRGRLVGQVLAAEETERRRLAEALHDEALQNLLFARQGFPAGISDKADRARDAIAGSIEQLRGAIFDLHPAVLEHAGLEAALREVAERQAERAGFQAEIDVDPAACGPLDPLLFVLGREQLTNAAKHSGATEVEVVVARNNGRVVMEVSDNGCGLEPERKRTAVERGHIGLASSAERVEALGGELEIESPAGGGTRIRTILPLRSS